MKGDTLSYGETQRFFQYLVINRKNILDTAIVKKYTNKFYNTTGLVPNISRFEALKYSGKMGIIENKELLDEIMNLYQEIMPQLLINTDYITRFKTGDFSNYLDSKLIINAIDSNRLGQILATDDILVNYLKRILTSIPAIQKSYINVIDQNKKIIGMIDKELE